jgi:hypothetical protein
MPGYVSFWKQTFRVAFPQRFLSASSFKNAGPSVTTLPPTTSTPREKSGSGKYPAVGPMTETKVSRKSPSRPRFYHFLAWVARMSVAVSCMLPKSSTIPAQPYQ